jgi:hypothetical protein
MNLLMRCVQIALFGSAAVACAAPTEEATGQSADDVTTGVSFSESPTFVEWRNASTSFRVYKTCLGPDPKLPGYIGHDGTAGPGYVAILRDASGRVLVDDTAVAAHIGPNSGSTGIGQFGFHLARVPQNTSVPFTAGDFKDERVFQISGRFCNANRRPTDYGGYNGFGVRSFSTNAANGYVAPSVDDKGVGHFGIEVTLGDAHSDLVRVRYTYLVHAHDVSMWVRVTNVCSEGKCDSAAANGDAFVKEPKIIAGVNPENPDSAGYQLMTMYDATPGVVGKSAKDNKWTNSCDSSQGFPAAAHICEYGGQNPVGKTGQCDDDARTKVRFWDGKSCANDPACLVIAVKSADAEFGATVPWAGAPHGLDAWALANVSESRDRAAAEDSTYGGRKTTCNDSAGSRGNRRWELAGFAKTTGCSYTTALAAFHAWEGGTGIFDCETLYYRFGKSAAGSEESYVTALSFGLNSVAAL